MATMTATGYLGPVKGNADQIIRAQDIILSLHEGRTWRKHSTARWNTMKL